jgi:carbon monoxide dehydrogenase subunit G
MGIVAKPVLVSVILDAPIEEVWADVEHLDTHVEWMADAAAIDFRGDQRAGVGTVMEVLTRLGPLHTTDVIEFTAWEPPHRMAVLHRGAFHGVGEFRLEEAGERRTRFSWEEHIEFPWWMGGGVGATVARPILSAVWRRNLNRLRDRFASG